MRWVVLLLWFVAGCDKLFSLNEIEDPDPAGRRERSITITQNSDVALVDFPVSIVIADADLAATALPDGSDIYFTDVQGAPLAHELVAYADGALEAWVRVTLGRVTEIRLVYGGQPITSTPSDTWSDLYEAVWHLAETADLARDSTRKDHDVFQSAVDKQPALVEGTVGKGRGFVEDVAGSDGLCAPAGDMIGFGVSSFSYSAWVHAGGLTGTFDQPFEAGGLTNGDGGFALELAAGKWAANLSDLGDAHDEILFDQTPNGRWAHAVIVVERPNVRTYIDGFQTNTAPLLMITTMSAIASESPICLGGRNGYTGQLDEVRIYTQPLVPAWIEAEYDNVVNRAEFVKLAPAS